MTGMEQEPGQTFSLTISVTRKDGPPWRKELSRRDLILLGAALVVFLLEPIFLIMIHVPSPADPPPVVAEKAPAAEPQGPLIRMDSPEAERTITPLNAADPTSLILSPGK